MSETEYAAALAELTKPAPIKYREHIVRPCDTLSEADYQHRLSEIRRGATLPPLPPSK